MLLEKALRLAQRHVRQSDKPSVQCFFLGSVLVDSGESCPHRVVRFSPVLLDTDACVL